MEKNSNRAEGVIFLMVMLTRKIRECHIRKIIKTQNYNAINQPTCEHDKYTSCATVHEQGSGSSTCILIT